MAVINVTPAREAASATEDEKGVVSYTVPYLVETDDTDDDASIVLAAAGLPNRGDSYALGNGSDSRATLRSLKATRDTGTLKKWMVVCEYSNSTSDGDDEDNNGQPNDGDPFDEPAQITYDGRTVEEIVEKDAQTGQLIANSAGHKFADPVTATFSKGVLRIARNQIVFTDFHASFADHLNRNVFSIFHKGFVFDFGVQTLLMQSPRAETRYRNDIQYVRVQYEMWHDPDGWRAKPLDAGFFELNSGQTFFSHMLVKGTKPLLDKNGQPFATEQLLDGQGQALSDGADPVFLDFNRYTDKDFDLLNLPDNVAVN